MRHVLVCSGKGQPAAPATDDRAASSAAAVSVVILSLPASLETSPGWMETRSQDHRTPLFLTGAQL